MGSPSPPRGARAPLRAAAHAGDGAALPWAFPRGGGVGRTALPARRGREAVLAAGAASSSRTPSSPSAALAAWRSTGLPEDVLAALPEVLGQFEPPPPSPVQREAIPRVLAGGSVLLASETGSGKTLAYLLPLVARLRAEEAAAGGVREARPGRPRALVLSPTRELAEQIFGVAKQVSHSARLRVALAGGGARAPTLAETSLGL